MYNIQLSEGGHKWEKQNLVTIFKGGRNYDIMKCANCGISGKTSSLTTIQLKGSYTPVQVHNCGGRLKTKIPNRIRIKYCEAVGRIFENLTPNSEHDVVTPPSGSKNDHTGVWVMGIGEPVRVLRREYETIK